MTRLTDNVALAQLSISDQKATAVDVVNQAKQALLNPVSDVAITSPSEELTQYTNTDARIKPALPSAIDKAILDAENAFKLRHPDPKRIVKRKGNILFRADGSLSLITHDGVVLDNVSKNEIPDMLAIEEQKYQEKQLYSLRYCRLE